MNTYQSQEKNPYRVLLRGKKKRESQHKNIVKFE